jgi:hypothetical protein
VYDSNDYRTVAVAVQSCHCRDVVSTRALEISKFVLSLHQQHKIRPMRKQERRLTRLR